MLRRIAVHLDQGAYAMSRFSFALNLAKEFNAEVQCIYVSPLPPKYWPGYVYGDYVMMAEVFEDLCKATRAERDKAEEHFLSAASEQGVKATWCSVEHAPAGELCAYARLSDLLVIGQENKQDPKTTKGDGFAERVIFSVGRPVLLLPRYFKQEAIGPRVLLCWDGSREAARALADAAPFLQVAGAVVTLTVQERASTLKPLSTSAEELKAYFRVHSYAFSKHVRLDAQEKGVGEVIANMVALEKVDLVVMGAYGHSRLREWVLGGATSYLLRMSSVPVLFSH